MNIEILPKEYERQLNWNDANFYCELLIVDGKSDWRLPTEEELMKICKSKNDLRDVFYWSSTEDDDGVGLWSDCAYSLYFPAKQCIPNKKFEKFFIRPIRNI